MTTKLTDDKIVELAHKIDLFILETASEFEANGIEFSAIALGRLMVFAKQVGSYQTFHEMMETIVKMADPKEPLAEQETQESP
jgi:hypothetical protein